MADDGAWKCQCRMCHGVHSAADAVQYVWEFALGACGVPTVVGVLVSDNGLVTCAFTYWHGEPTDRFGLSGCDEYLVSFRPDGGTIPTEGDVARWMDWESSPQPPCDWLLACGRRFRSVQATVDALRRREPLPGEETIAGDWDEALVNQEFRAAMAADWAETVRRNRATTRW
jgi:hypothetical protein